MAWYNDIGWWTGDTQRREQADAYNKAQMTAAGTQNAAFENLAKAQEAGFAAQEPWNTKAIQQMQDEYNQRQGMIASGVQNALNALSGGQNATTLAAGAQDAARMGAIRQGMNLDMNTLSQMLGMSLGTQQPYAAASQQLLSTMLPALLSSMGYGNGPGLPTSQLAQLQMEDSDRKQRAALQRQGLEGSGMAAAQQAATRRRVLAEDQQNQWNRALQMLTQGFQGQNMLSGTINQYASQMGQIGNRLGAFTPYDLASQYAQTAAQKANQISRGAEMAQSVKSGLPEAYGQLGTFVNTKLTDPARTRLSGMLGIAGAQSNTAIPQSTSGFGLLSDAFKLYAGAKGAFGGGSGGSVSSPDWYYNMPMSAQAQ